MHQDTSNDGGSNELKTNQYAAKSNFMNKSEGSQNKKNQSKHDGQQRYNETKTSDKENKQDIFYSNSCTVNGLMETEPCM